MALVGDGGEHDAGVILGDHHPVQVLDDVVAADHVVALEIDEPGDAGFTGAGRLLGRGIVHRGAQHPGRQQVGVVGDLADLAAVEQLMLIVGHDDFVALAQLGVEQGVQRRRVEIADQHAAGRPLRSITGCATIHWM